MRVNTYEAGAAGGQECNSPALPLPRDQTTVDSVSASSGTVLVAPPSPDEDKRRTSSVIIVLVALCLLYPVDSGMENGLSPCALTTMQQEMNATTASIAAAQQMAEVAKILLATTVGRVGRSPHRPVVRAAGSLVVVLGMVTVGLAPSAVIIGVGFFLFGVGEVPLTVLLPPVFDDMVPRQNKHFIPHYVGLVYMSNAVGVAACFLVCGATIDRWRYLYYFAPLVQIPGVILLLVGHQRFRQCAPLLESDIGSGNPGATSIATTTERTGSTSTLVEEKSVTNVKGFLAALTGGESPEEQLSTFRVNKLVLSNPVIFFTTLCQTFIAFFSAAFISLIPKFVEVGLGESKGVSSFVMASTVPAAALGCFLGGYICKKMKFLLRQQLLFCVVTCGLSVPLIFAFAMKNLVGFIVVIVVAMIVVFANTSPSYTLLALAAAVQHRQMTMDAAAKRRTMAAAGNGVVSDASPSIDSGALPQEDGGIPSLAVMVSTANGATNFISRAVGGIPGPIVLAALVDASGGQYPLYAAYLTVGIIGAVGAFLTALLAWKLAGPEDGTESAVAEEMVEGGGGGVGCENESPPRRCWEASPEVPHPNPSVTFS